MKKKKIKEIAGYKNYALILNFPNRGISEGVEGWVRL